MKSQDVVIGVLVDEIKTYSYQEVCEQYHLPAELLQDMLEQGLFPNDTTDLSSLYLNQQSIRHIKAALRLHRDLGVNLPGAVLAIELIKEIDQLNQELNILRKYSG